MQAPQDNFNGRKWLSIALINLLLVAFAGIVMRYKITWALPAIEQKNFLDAHYRFAFSGWVSQAIMTLMITYLFKVNHSLKVWKYHWLLIANLAAAYLAFITHAFFGQSIVSIIGSSATILISYVFAISYWIDLNKSTSDKVTKLWFKAALVFNVSSSLGIFSVLYMMATKTMHPNVYLASSYYFLHFQYNGWFFFGCMGLLNQKLFVANTSEKLLKKIFLLFFLAFIPAYLLSVLWLHFPGWLYILVVAAVIAQLEGLYFLFTLFKKNTIAALGISSQTKWILICALIALTIKLLLQALSTIPFLSKYAYGFRPVVIGYLHLVLLGVITLFILGYARLERMISFSRISSIGIKIFIIGIILNEILLLIQGLSYMNYISIPFINQSLFSASVTMLLGIAMLNIGNRKDNIVIQP